VSQQCKIPKWETEMKKIAPGVYAYIQAVGGWCISNAGLIVGEDYAIVVDSLTSVPLTQNFIKEIEKVTDKPVRYLINTHDHGDHIWANHLFKDASIVSSIECREEIAKQDEYPDMSNFQKLLPHIDFKGVKNTIPDITFDSELCLYQKNREVHLIHKGVGHTTGDTIVYLPKEGVMFAGDILFIYGTPLCLTGSILGWIKYLDMMLGMDAKIFVPGHGPVCGKEAVIDVREYLSIIYNEGRKRFDKGMTAAQAAKDIALGRFQDWSNWRRVAANVDRLFREFRGERPADDLSEFIPEFFAKDQP